MPSWQNVASKIVVALANPAEEGGVRIQKSVYFQSEWKALFAGNIGIFSRAATP
jgi:hypothetical protein